MFLSLAFLDSRLVPAGGWHLPLTPRAAPPLCHFPELTNAVQRQSEGGRRITQYRLLLVKTLGLRFGNDLQSNRPGTPPAHPHCYTGGQDPSVTHRSQRTRTGGPEGTVFRRLRKKEIQSTRAPCRNRGGRERQAVDPRVVLWNRCPRGGG